MKSNAYWINRVNEVLADNHQSSTEQIIRINKAYEKAAKDLQKDIDKIFIKYATGHNMTLTDAKRALNGKIPNNVDELRLRLAQTSNEELKKSILAELNKNAYKARITRLEALKQSLSVNYKLLADKELKLSKKIYIRTIKEAYYRTCYNFQSGINLAFDVANINTRAVNMILNTEWFGRNYSDSVWNNTQALVDRLDETITSGFLSGKSLKDIAKNIAELSSFGMFAAERLVRSETTFFNNQAALQGYKEVGVEEYVYVCTLDLRTCSCGKKGKPGCQQLDRKVFKISEQEPGKNCPPMHAFCRCTVRSYINDEILNRAKRRARDPETGKTYLVDNMSYEDWKNKYINKDMTVKVDDVVATNKNGKEIEFDTGTFKEKGRERIKTVVTKLSNEYNTNLTKVTKGVGGEAGHVDLGGTMYLSSSTKSTIYHEFAHSITMSDATKYKLVDDSLFWKEINKVRREYEKACVSDHTFSISAYSHQDKDEFIAEAFTQYKLKDTGELNEWYGKDYTYSKRVVEIIDKYFKK